MFFLLVFFVSLLLTALFIKLSLAFNIVDDFNNKEAELKIHKKRIPIMGGIAVLLSLILGFLMIFFVFPNEFFVGVDFFKISSILFLCILISGLSFLDDCKQINFVWRLLLHIFAGIFLVIVDIKIAFVFFPILSFFITIFYVVGVINSFNMIDGMDGICSGTAVLSCVGFFLFGLNVNDIFLIFISVGLAGALIGFLVYNFNPAKIFLGDNGSTLIGFLLSVMAIIASGYARNFVGYLIPVLLLGIPVFDMMFAVLRRLKARKSIFMGDRGHIYDLLLARGYCQRKVFFMICILQTSLVGIALFLYFV